MRLVVFMRKKENDDRQPPAHANVKREFFAEKKSPEMLQTRRQPPIITNGKLPDTLGFSFDRQGGAVNNSDGPKPHNFPQLVEADWAQYIPDPFPITISKEPTKDPSRFIKEVGGEDGLTFGDKFKGLFYDLSNFDNVTPPDGDESFLNKVRYIANKDDRCEMSVGFGILFLILVAAAIALIGVAIHNSVKSKRGVGGQYPHRPGSYGGYGGPSGYGGPGGYTGGFSGYGAPSGYGGYEGYGNGYNGGAPNYGSPQSTGFYSRSPMSQQQYFQ
jgi:hypothetical protein